MKHLHQRRLSRRGFLRLAGAGCAACAAAGAAGYGFESATLPPPLPAEAAAAPLAGDPGDAPLLLLTGGGIGGYLGELLRAEGMLAFAEAPAAALGPGLPEGRRALLLGPGPLPDGSAELLRGFVAEGGGLVAVAPSPELDGLLGLRRLGGSEAAPAIRLRPAHPLAAAADPGPLQIHAPLDRLALDGAEAAALAEGSGLPAVTTRRLGRGLAVAWAFDLGRSLALSRQGNPAWAGQERDGLDGVRAADMFRGWVDQERMGVPHADELMRLLSASLAAASPAPLPRLWYLPAGAGAALVLSGDAHGSNTPALEQAIGIAEAHGAAMSIYYTPPPASAARRLLRKARWSLGGLPVVGGAFAGGEGPPSPREVASWRERGHEFGMHPYVEPGLEAGYGAHWSDFVKLGYGPVAPTVRTHRILWRGWVDNPRVQACYGIGMNLDHYHAGPAVRRPDGGFSSGFLTGSGLPMRFVDEGGRLLSVYQQQTHIVDEQLMEIWGDGESAGLGPEAAAAVSEELLRRCLERYPAALGVQCHVDSFSFGGERAAAAAGWLSRLLAAAAAAGAPVLSAEGWLRFSERRAATRAGALRWDEAAGELAMEVEAPAGAELSLLLPARHGPRALRGVAIDGSDVPVAERRLAGQAYGIVPLAGGRQRLVARYGGAGAG